MLRRFISQAAATLPQRRRFLISRQCSSSSATSSSQTPAEPSVESPPSEIQSTDDYSSKPSARISVDRSGLNNPPEHSHEPTADSDLVKHLKSIIKFRGGPISVAEYMEEVLINPKAGFYINRDVFGAEGDFITSPEVSQMFGEMVGVWAMCLWEQMGQPNKVNLVELGPGRGTLMADLLRGASKFEKFTNSLHIHMIERRFQPAKLELTILESCLQQAIHNLFEISWPCPQLLLPMNSLTPYPFISFRFRVVLSPQPTPATLYLLKRCKWAQTEELKKLEHVEVCPKAMDLTQSIAKRISSDGGGALIIDYGLDGIVSDSLQAIRKHKFVDMLDDPGSADLSAYVDFPAIRHSAEEISGDVSVYGPITQSQFLGNLGINFRVEALLQNCTEEQAESLRTGYWRLVGDGEAPFWEGPDEQTPIGMGSRYLAMAIVNKKQGTPVPFQ
ncbi:S-adenosyl-L-methionine-dependent methyltransferase MidA [Artemisia annua]|uniref:Protein arginine methyltransferase NDUFAF7 n=1 Tax=Artemisia annua TaxID=35608 RepID=A0A2U1P8B6_ARTAN|nr:S-adenosyl-L-methionine-dependent methyltransferase MidA [Artemisia annua]